jgi:hypothetical protein
MECISSLQRAAAAIISYLGQPLPKSLILFPWKVGRDVFIGLDYSLTPCAITAGNWRPAWRGALWFLVHDLLPQEKPEWFSRNTVIRYRAWLGILADTADGFLCNSLQTEQDLKRNLDHEFALTRIIAP